MECYLMKLEPIEPYFLGTERKFSYDQDDLKSPYYIKSGFIPSQITILGLLRFLLLKRMGLLKDDYSQNEDLIGSKSFNLEVKNRLEIQQNFGAIHNIGPLFLIDNQEKLYIKSPYNHQKEESTYQPYQLKAVSSNGIDTSVVLENFSGKLGISDSYLRISDKKIFETKEIFREEVRVGIFKEDEKSAFFKKGYMALNTEQPITGFGCFIELDETNPLLTSIELEFQDVLFIGQGKAVCKVTLKKQEETLQHHAQTILAQSCNQNVNIYYALSDTLFIENPNYCYSIIKKEYLRNLITKPKQVRKPPLKKSNLYQVVKAGSVFFVKNEDTIAFENACHVEDYKKIGMNHIIKIGGYQSEK